MKIFKLVYNFETKSDRQILFASLIVLNSLKNKGFQKKFSKSNKIYES